MKQSLRVNEISIRFGFTTCGKPDWSVQVAVQFTFLNVHQFFTVSYDIFLGFK